MDLAVHELEEEQEVVVLPPVGQAQDLGVVVHSEVVNSLYSGEVVPGLPFLVAPEHRHPGTDQIIIDWWAWCSVWGIMDLGWSITHGSRFNLDKRLGM